jgi:hypothetical protein
MESRDCCIKLTKVRVLPSDQRHSHRCSKTPPSETLMKIEDLGDRSRVGGARSSSCSKAQVRVLWLGFMSKGVLQNNLDSGNLHRSILEKDLDSSGK